MANPDGWWNRALRQWGASADGCRKSRKGKVELCVCLCVCVWCVCV